MYKSRIFQQRIKNEIPIGIYKFTSTFFFINLQVFFDKMTKIFDKYFVFKNIDFG
jgi:hypothetical protein